MSEYKQKTKQTTKTAEETDVAPPTQPTETSAAADIDAILDEIDEVLEVNAEEFVAQYIQKGGQ